MRRSVERLAAVIAVAVLAGCGGTTGYAPGTVGETETTEQAPAIPDPDHRGLFVSNARSASYDVSVLLVDGPVDSLNVTYRNGTRRIVSVPEKPAPLSPTLFGPYESIRSLEPVNETVTLRKAVGPRTNASLRFSIGWERPTLVVVVENRSDEEAGVEQAQLLACDRPHSRFERLRVDIHREAAAGTISIGTRCE